MIRTKTNYTDTPLTTFTLSELDPCLIDEEIHAKPQTKYNILEKLQPGPFGQCTTQIED